MEYTFLHPMITNRKRMQFDPKVQASELGDVITSSVSFNVKGPRVVLGCGHAFLKTDIDTIVKHNEMDYQRRVEQAATPNIERMPPTCPECRFHFSGTVRNIHLLEVVIDAIINPACSAQEIFNLLLPQIQLARGESVKCYDGHTITPITGESSTAAAAKAQIEPQKFLGMHFGCKKCVQISVALLARLKIDEIFQCLFSVEGRDQMSAANKVLEEFRNVSIDSQNPYPFQSAHFEKEKRKPPEEGRLQQIIYSCRTENHPIISFSITMYSDQCKKMELRIWFRDTHAATMSEHLDEIPNVQSSPYRGNELLFTDDAVIPVINYFLLRNSLNSDGAQFLLEKICKLFPDTNTRRNIVGLLRPMIDNPSSTPPGSPLKEGEGS